MSFAHLPCLRSFCCRYWCRSLDLRQRHPTGIHSSTSCRCLLSSCISRLLCECSLFHCRQRSFISGGLAVHAVRSVRRQWWEQTSPAILCCHPSHTYCTRRWMPLLYHEEYRCSNCLSSKHHADLCQYQTKFSVFSISCLLSGANVKFPFENVSLIVRCLFPLSFS